MDRTKQTSMKNRSPPFNAEDYGPRKRSCFLSGKCKEPTEPRLMIPFGAFSIVQQLAAEELMQRLVLDFSTLLGDAKAKSLSEIHSLVQQSPAICLRKYQVVYDNGPRTIKDELFPLGIIYRLNPTLETLQTVYEANPQAVLEKCGLWGEIPLHKACLTGSIEIVSFLLSKEPSTIATETNDGYTPLYYALNERSSLSLYQYLVNEWPEAAHKCTENTSSPWSLLHRAVAKKANLDVVQDLYHRNPDTICHQDGRKKRTPLMSACLYRSYPAFEFLCDCMTDSLTLRDHEGNTVLRYAIFGDHRLDVIQKLIPPHDPLVRIDAKGSTLLHAAVNCDGRHYLIPYLAETYPEMVWARDNYGNMPIHIAAYESIPIEYVESMVLHGTDKICLAQGRDGTIPLETARKFCSYDLIQFLETVTAEAVAAESLQLS